MVIPRNVWITAAKATILADRLDTRMNEKQHRTFAEGVLKGCNETLVEYGHAQTTLDEIEAIPLPVTIMSAPITA